MDDRLDPMPPPLVTDEFILFFFFSLFITVIVQRVGYSCGEMAVM